MISQDMLDKFNKLIREGMEEGARKMYVALTTTPPTSSGKDERDWDCANGVDGCDCNLPPGNDEVTDDFEVSTPKPTRDTVGAMEFLKSTSPQPEEEPVSKKNNAAGRDEFTRIAVSRFSDQYDFTFVSGGEDVKAYTEVSVTLTYDQVKQLRKGLKEVLRSEENYVHAVVEL